MPSTRKKVLVRSRTRGLVRGYLDPQNFRDGGSIQFLSPEGQLVRLPAVEVKAIYFVAQFEVGDRLNERRPSASRPRLDGLWVRIAYPDREMLEGLLANNLLDLEGHGLNLTPASLAAEFQRVYIPREAIAEARVLGVIGGQRTGPRRPQPSVAATAQGDLFAGSN